MRPVNKSSGIYDECIDLFHNFSSILFQKFSEVFESISCNFIVEKSLPEKIIWALCYTYIPLMKHLKGAPTTHVDVSVKTIQQLYYFIYYLQKMWSLYPDYVRINIYKINKIVLLQKSDINITKWRSSEIFKIPIIELMICLLLVDFRLEFSSDFEIIFLTFCS